MGPAIVQRYPGSAGFGLSLTFDVEMATNFPYWTSVWDHRKGAIDEDVKAYVRQLTRACRQAAVQVQFFLLGASLEDPDVEYLRELAADGHALGNHTYHHVNVKATTTEQLQLEYRLRPWLAAGRAPLEVIRDELRQTSAAMRERLGVTPAGFRTPGGFATGLHDVPQVQRVLLEEGFVYASSQYPLRVEPAAHPSLEALEAASC